MPKVPQANKKPRGKLTAYAFFMQTCRQDQKEKQSKENVNFVEFSRKCAEQWKEMTDIEKKRYQELAEQDKKRYEEEMESYIPLDNDDTVSKRRKKQKDPNEPKRPMTACFLFFNDERSNVKQSNPGLTAPEVSKELGRRWAALDSDSKNNYKRLAEMDKARFEKEIAEYRMKTMGGPSEVEDDKEANGEGIN